MELREIAWVAAQAVCRTRKMQQSSLKLSDSWVVTAEAAAVSQLGIHALIL
jgi:hypothetical protein